MRRKIHVVINPASGRPKPILHILNRVFNQAQVEWDISLTKTRGDAERFAHEAVTNGGDIVAAYGGDGTVMETAQRLLGSAVPLAILPGGSANLIAVELGIPKDLDQPAREISVSDELLDVLLLSPQGMVKIISTGPSLFDSPKDDTVISHWQASQIVIEVDPPQPVQVDGEMVGNTPVSVIVLPGALKVIAPVPGQKYGSAFSGSQP